MNKTQEQKWYVGARRDAPYVVFQSREGQPMSEQVLKSVWRRLKKPRRFKPDNWQPRMWGFHSKPVHRSLAILDSIGAIEYVEGSSLGRALTPFTVKIKREVARLFTDDGCPFFCSPTGLHKIAKRIEAK